MGARSTTATFECRGCNFRTKNYSSIWRRHLLEETHQERAREMLKTMESKKKSAVIFGAVTMKENELLKYFGDVAPVLDFVFWKNRVPDFIIVTFLSSSFLKMTLNANHKIQGKQLVLRPLSDISEAEWVSICPFAALQPMQVDLTMSSPEDPFNDESEYEEMSDGESREQLLPSSSIEERNRNSELDRSIRSLEQGLGINCDTPCVEDNENEDDVELKFDKGQLDSETMLNQILEDFYDRNLRKPKYNEMRKYAKGSIEALLKVPFPKCVLIPFGLGGSTAIVSAAGPGEKLNLFLDTEGHTTDTSGKSHTMNVDAMENEKLVKKISNVLHRSPFIHNLRIVQDKVCFNFQETESSDVIVCKLQVKNFLAAQCCRLVNFMCKLDSRVRALSIIIRQWAYHHNLVMSNPGNNSSESCFDPVVFQWLVIMFLINEEILPTIETLQTFAKTPLYHGGVNIAFCDNPEEVGWNMNPVYGPNSIDNPTPSAQCILSLAQRFFEFFSKTTFSSVFLVNIGVNMHNRRILKPRPNASPTGPFKTVNAWESTKRIIYKVPICVQNPLKLYLNMTMNVNGPVATHFEQECRAASRYLLDFLNKDFTKDNFENPIQILIYPDSLLEAPANNSIDYAYDNDEATVSILAAKNSDAETVQNATKPKARKLKFSLVLNLMKSANSTQATQWLELFERFNSRVWPICFGVQLYELENEDKLSDKPGVRVQLVPPFRGVIMKSGSLNWAHSSNHPKKGKLDKEMKMVFDKMYQRLEDKKIKVPQIVQFNPNDPNLKEFSFECDVKGKADQSKGTIKLNFIKVLYIDRSEKAVQKNIRFMYRELWSHYSRARLSKD